MILSTLLWLLVLYLTQLSNSPKALKVPKFDPADKLVSQKKLPILIFVENKLPVIKAIIQLLHYRRNDQFPIIVYQDPKRSETNEIIRSLQPVSTIYPPNDTLANMSEDFDQIKTSLSARKYKWSIDSVFSEPSFDSIIILEDVTEVSMDFYEYFLAMREVLMDDETLWCVSAWNDNGQYLFINPKRTDLLYRTDYFSGKAWMMTRKVWNELRTKWPQTDWEEWMRKREQRKDRSCVRPEVSRVTHHSDVFNVLADKYVQFPILATHVLKKNVYDVKLEVALKWSNRTTFWKFLTNPTNVSSLVITYDSKSTLSEYAKELGLQNTPSEGVIPNSYRGVVTFHRGGCKVFLVPASYYKNEL